MSTNAKVFLQKAKTKISDDSEFSELIIITII